MPWPGRAGEQGGRSRYLPLLLATVVIASLAAAAAWRRALPPTATLPSTQLGAASMGLPMNQKMIQSQHSMQQDVDQENASAEAAGLPPPVMPGSGGGAVPLPGPLPLSSPPLPPPLLSHAAEDAGIVLEHCSPTRRALVAARVLNGSLPPVLSWGCDLEQCPGAFVKRIAATLRSTPRFASLTTMLPCDIYSAIQGRTLWVVGDSQQQRFYRQLRCFLGPFLEPGGRRRRDVAVTQDPAQQKLIREELLKGWDCCGVDMPICTHLVGGTRVCHIRVNKGTHLVNYYMRKIHLLNVSRKDIWHTNVGLWHHKRDREYAGLMRSLADLYTRNKSTLPTVIWRDNSPQHFMIQNGEFPHPSVAWKILGGFKGCQAIQGARLLPDGRLNGTNAHVLAGGWRNKVSTPLLQAAGMPIHATWNDTFPFYDGHTKGECSHFCSPGGYSLWIWSLWRTLLRLEGGGELVQL